MYKRQGFSRGGIAYRYDQIHGGGTFGSKLVPRPVSYTHLDVYKRQHYAISMRGIDGQCAHKDSRQIVHY